MSFDKSTFTMERVRLFSTPQFKERTRAKGFTNGRFNLEKENKSRTNPVNQNILVTEGFRTICIIVNIQPLDSGKDN